ncbi:response regulator [Bacteroides heparinolyticus]|uniref:response regulator n=1 Tax=Prevotella heparinolytica TaxID=28113 RepID=UPI0035A02D30
MMIQVHIADDHRMLVEGLQAAIEESGTAKVVDISHTLAACRTTLRFRHPDVLLLDISMPDGSGIDFCKEMHEAYPDMKILMLTSYDEYTMVNRAIAAGASGYIQKNALSEEVVKGIETVMAGDTYFSRDIDRMMKKHINHAVWLTVREQELLRHIVDGCTNQEIADRMFLSVETIKTYRKNLTQKFGTKNAVELVQIAIRDKWV